MALDIRRSGDGGRGGGLDGDPRFRLLTGTDGPVRARFQSAYAGKVRALSIVARWRVRAAKELLTSSEISVLEIAIEVGFNSRSTFYKAFKRETGLTPSAYRAQQSSPAR